MKSYVTMEQHICPICGEVHETGNLLLDKRLKERFERNTITGMSFCPKHKKMEEEGWVFFVEIEPPTGTLEGASRLKPSQVALTGRNAAIRKDVAEELLKTDKVEPISYIHPELMDKLVEMSEQAKGEESCEEQE